MVFVLEMSIEVPMVSVLEVSKMLEALMVSVLQLFQALMVSVLQLFQALMVFVLQLFQVRMGLKVPMVGKGQMNLRR